MANTLTTTLADAQENLTWLERRELRHLHNDLTKLVDQQRQFNEKRKGVTLRIARYCLSLVKKTPRNVAKIQKTAHVITQFIWYQFTDEFDEILSIAKLLEMPAENTKVFYVQWVQLKQKLRNYIGE